MTNQEIATVVCQRVAELDDRNSPAGLAEMMLVTASELHAIVCDALHDAGYPIDPLEATE